MKRAKRVFIITFALVLLSQVPFAYRRYKLGRLNAAIQVVNSSRSARDIALSPEKFLEYRGVIHVHSSLGGHSTGTFQEIIAAAKSNKLDFVIMTEHGESEFDTSALTLNGVHGGVLFVNGNEVSSANGERLLAIPGDRSLSEASKLSTNELASNNRARGALSIAAYPEEFSTYSENIEGMEVYNVFTNAKRINRLVAFFDTLWSHRSYPDLVFAHYFHRPDENLRKWDELLVNRKVLATAGNDSHANIGLSINDSSGNVLVGLKVDPYETSFRLVQMHVLIPTDEVPRSQTGGRLLDQSSLIKALLAGHCFVGFDLFSDTTGFRFEATSRGLTKVQGDEIPLQADTQLTVTLPVSGRLLIFKNGQVILDEAGVKTKAFGVTERGAYRVEVYLPQLGTPIGQQPWIISNPIYVR